MMMNPPYKVFQVGFNKCGTRSLCQLFKQSGYDSVHYQKGRLAKKILQNFLRSRDILSGINKHTFYSDLECAYGSRGVPIYAYLLYKEIYYQYPNSKFILNVRPIDDWIRSRLRHSNRKYVRFCKKRLKLNKGEVVEEWKNHFHKHIEDVIGFFIDKPDRLLVYDISTDNPDKIINFFPELNLDISKWGHYGKTKKR